MPMFLSKDEYESCALGAPLVAEKLAAFLTELDNQVQHAKAAQQQAGLPLPPPQIYLQLSDAVITELLETKAADAQPEQTRRSGLPLLPHQIYHKSAMCDGEIERSSSSNELPDLRALLEQKDSEISQKNDAIDHYVDEIEYLMCRATLREARLEEIELELAESRASCTRLSQELSSSKANQGRYLAEISVYKKVIKDYFQKRLVEEKSARIEFEKEAASLKEKVEQYEALDEERKDNLGKLVAEVEKRILQYA